MKKLKQFVVLILMAAMNLCAGGYCISALAETIVLPKSLKSIDDKAFYGNILLENVDIQDGLETIGSQAFAGTSIKTIYIPDSVTYIADDAFDGLQDLNIIAYKDSYAYNYAQNYGITVQIARDYVTFGHYPQTASGKDKTPIEWIILEKDESKAFVISRYGLDYQSYHEIYLSRGHNWSESTLREWLNSTFLNKAFSSSEKKLILTTEVDNSRTQYYNCGIPSQEIGFPSYSNTFDKIFLLSCAEANQYFGAINLVSNIEARVAPTAYAIKLGAPIDTYTTNSGMPAGYWLLRTPGFGISRGAVYNIYFDGMLCTVPSIEGETIRPAMWIDISAIK